MIVYHVYNQVRPFVWESGEITTAKPEHDQWIKHDVKLLDSGLVSVHDQSRIRRRDPICIGTAKDGSKWEMFIDHSYFDMICVRRVNDRDFNSPHNYNFVTVKKAIDGMDEILKKWSG